MVIPEPLTAISRSEPRGAEWLERLPDVVDDLRNQWSLTLGDPFPGSTCAWVAPATRADGTTAVLKIGFPHMEAEHEIAGLRFWDGDGVVRVVAADGGRNAMLLEACVPGTPLKQLPEAQQDVVLAELLPKLWQRPPRDHAFRPLSEMLAYWTDFTLADEKHWPDAGLVRQGLALFEELSRAAPDNVLLFTDLHAGNVLRAEREPWLAIDPKPFIGDPAYDTTQHLFNSIERMLDDPDGVLEDFSGRLGVNQERVRLWTFARAAADPRDRWDGSPWFEVARKIAP